MSNIFLVVFSFSFILSFLIVLLSGRVDWLCNSGDLLGEQKFHTRPTPRIGGVSVVLSFFLGLYFLDISSNIKSAIFLSSMPVFLIGLLEDINANITPFTRLLFTFFSVILTFFLLDIRVFSLGIGLVDFILSNFLLVSLIFTVIVVSGVIHATNIIDGYNGLMIGYSMFVLLAITYVASTLGDSFIVQLSLLLFFSLLGVLLFNFPYGRIFMGDAGAYFVGLIMAIIALMLSTRHESVTNWFVLLLFIYPLYEVVFSIYRKRFIRETPSSQPDGYHLHMLIYKRLIRCSSFKNNKTWCNSMTSPFLWLLSLTSIIPAVIWYDNQTALIVCAFMFMIIYTVLYRRIVHFRFKFGK